MLIGNFARKFRVLGFAVIGITAVGLAGAASPAQAAGNPHYTRGILTKTVYFNRAETQRMATSADEAYAFGSTLRPEYSYIVTGFSGQVNYFAAKVNALGYCVKLKNTGSLGYYSGSAGDGYCR